MEKRLEVFDREGTVAEPQKRVNEQQIAGYSDKVLEEAASPSNMRRMAEADACGIIHGCCGDTMEIYLRLDAETIKDATFMTDGSEPAVACGSVLTKLLKGMSLAEAGHVRPEELINALDGLPPVKTHCTKLTLNTLGKAIANGGGEQ